MKSTHEAELGEMERRAERLIDSDVGYEDVLARDVLRLVAIVRKMRGGGVCLLGWRMLSRE